MSTSAGCSRGAVHARTGRVERVGRTHAERGVERRTAGIGRALVDAGSAQALRVAVEVDRAGVEPAALGEVVEVESPIMSTLSGIPTAAPVRMFATMAACQLPAR